MKGVLFNVVEEVVEELFSAQKWDAILVEAGLDGAYTALGNYPADELVLIVETAAGLLGLPEPDVWRTVGDHALPRLAARLPPAAVGGTDAESFLRRVNDIIHPEVRKWYPDATPPVFTFEDSADGLLVRYRSPRSLTALAEGLIVGCGRLYGEEVDVQVLPALSTSEVTCFLVVFGPVGFGRPV